MDLTLKERVSILIGISNTSANLLALTSYFITLTHTFRLKPYYSWNHGLVVAPSVSLGERSPILKTGRLFSYPHGFVDLFTGRSFHPRIITPEKMSAFERYVIINCVLCKFTDTMRNFACFLCIE
jgi:hypothetical protein